jgi:hypothetical protein
VGSGAYDHMEQRFPGQVLGIDVAEDHAQQQLDMGRNVIQGDPTSADFWDRVRTPNQVEMIMLTLPSLATSLAVLRQLDDYAYGGTISAVARYPDEIPLLEAGGAALVFNIYTEAGTGFAEHVMASAKLRS